MLGVAEVDEMKAEKNVLGLLRVLGCIGAVGRHAALEESGE